MEAGVTLDLSLAAMAATEKPTPEEEEEARQMEMGTLAAMEDRAS